MPIEANLESAYLYYTAPSTLIIDLFEKWLPFNYSFICIYQPRLCVCNFKESLVRNEASKANLDESKRIIKWQPFFE